MRYDLIVIGGSPSGCQAALTAAKLHKKVVLVEQRPEGSGVSAPVGVSPAKALREAILLLTGFRHRVVCPELYGRRRLITMPELQSLFDQVVQKEAECVSQELQAHGVEKILGRARFVGPRDVEITHGSEVGRRQLSGEKILVAVGSQPIRPSWVPFDGHTIVDADDLLKLERIPRTMIVVGGGVTGLQYAMMFAVLGTHVGVVDVKTSLLDFCDAEMTRLVQQQAESLGVKFLLGRRVIGVEQTGANRTTVRLEGGNRLQSNTVLFAAGRRGNTESLNLQAAGLTPDEQGRLWCNEHYQTWVKHIYGVGDVVGFPALASMALEQGRHAMEHAFEQRVSTDQQISYGLHTVPELAMIGPTEEKLRDERISYEVGVSEFRELARGHIAGRPEGLLKLLFDRESLRLLAVHCLGESATELIRIGETVMSFDGTIEYLRDTVFDYPTMAECYKLAAINALNHVEVQPPWNKRQPIQVARRLSTTFATELATANPHASS